MRLLRRSVLAGCWLAFAGCHRDAPPPAREPAAAAGPDTSLGALVTDSAAVSAARFTQGFYDWYAGRGWRLETALREGRAYFSAELHRALVTDFEAQARNPDEIVGLDGDPFLNGQDPCGPYRVRRTTRRADTLLVAVHSECTDAAPRRGPDAIAEVQRSGSTWVFVDFRYVDPSSDLLTQLTALRRDREADTTRHR